MYRVRIERAAVKSLARITEPHRSRIESELRTLQNDPRPPGCTKLKGRDAWRIRAGDYRIIYEIHDEVLVVLVVEIGHRRDIYR